MKEKVDKILISDRILVGDPIEEKIINGFIAIKGNKIYAIEESEKLKNFEAKDVFKFKNSVVLPGLINTHTHAAMSLLRGFSDVLPLKKWLEEYIWPVEKKYLSEEFIKDGVELSCTEMIMSGTTCFADMYFFQNVTKEVVEKSGIRAILAESYFDETSFSVAKKRLEKFKETEMQKKALGPHSIYSCSEKVLNETSDFAKAKGLKIFTHLAETKKEFEDSIKNFSKTPTETLRDAGILGENTICAHSIFLTEEDEKILEKTKTGISHCPRSNFKLSSGEFKINPKLKISLGTDGAASNNSQNLFKEISMAALLYHKNFKSGEILRPSYFLRLATLGGAEILGMKKEIGSLEKDKKADICVVNLNQIHLSPIYDIFSHIAFSLNGSEVSHVFCDGELIMEERQILNLDQEKIMQNAEKWRNKINSKK